MILKIPSKKCTTKPKICTRNTLNIMTLKNGRTQENCNRQMIINYEPYIIDRVLMVNVTLIHGSILIAPGSILRWTLKANNRQNGTLKINTTM